MGSCATKIPKESSYGHGGRLEHRHSSMRLKYGDSTRLPDVTPAVTPAQSPDPDGPNQSDIIYSEDNDLSLNLSGSSGHNLLYKQCEIPMIMPQTNQQLFAINSIQEINYIQNHHGSPVNSNQL
mmetsp:Transcript_31053/g.27341  ORF Transcript_31053/g.27341 Transcript_31053/m.27341 type:complete len:124 (-) Transcript_31053:381-752(-)